MAIFGDLEIDKAIALFGKYNFSGAKERLETLQETIPEPDMRQQLHFVYLLADAYDAWDALEFERAARGMAELYRQLKRDVRMHPDFLLADRIEQIRAQERMLQQLGSIPKLINQKKNEDILKTKEIIVPLMFTMQMNALTREKQGKLDMATLLLYRLLEMIEQRRLSAYDLFVSEMQYEKMKINDKALPELKEMSASDRVEWLRNEVNRIKDQVFRNNRAHYLPDPVSLMDGYIILAALRDPLFQVRKGDSMAILKRMRSVVFLRNNSIFAHGLGPVSEGDYRKFRDFVVELFQHFCRIEKISYKIHNEIFNWVMPKEIGDMRVKEEE